MKSVCVCSFISRSALDTCSNSVVNFLNEGLTFTSHKKSREPRPCCELHHCPVDTWMSVVVCHSQLQSVPKQALSFIFGGTVSCPLLRESSITARDHICWSWLPLFQVFDLFLTVPTLQTAITGQWLAHIDLGKSAWTKNVYFARKTAISLRAQAWN